MGKPSYDAETLATYFHAPSPALFDDPVCGAELRRLRDEDPDIIAAVADEDRSLIRRCLEATPEERLRNALGLADTILRLRDER